MEFGSRYWVAITVGEEDVASVEFKTHQWFSGADSLAALILQF